MRVSINLDAKTADLFNQLRGDRSIGAFGLECIIQQLTTLNRGKDDEKKNTVRFDETLDVLRKQG